MVNPLTRVEEWKGFAFRKEKKHKTFSKSCSYQYVPLDGNPPLIRQKGKRSQG